MAKPKNVPAPAAETPRASEPQKGLEAYRAYAERILPELGIKELDDFGYDPSGKIYTTEEIAALVTQTQTISAK